MSVSVIKIGGSTHGSRDTLIDDIVALQKQGESLVIVHGGGKIVTEWLRRQNIPTKFTRGERVTDLSTLEVATAVLAGLVNKEITAMINLKGGRAVGISGSDGSLMESRMKDREMGYVGESVKVNPAVLETLLGAGFIPVVSPISLYTEARKDEDPPIININGDPFAGDLAVALKASRLIYLTDVAGVTNESGNVISRLTPKQAEVLIESGVIAGGMIPKVNACLRALKIGAIARIIDGKQSHALLDAFESQVGGTTIVDSQ